MYDAGIGRLQADGQKGFMQLAAGSYSVIVCCSRAMLALLLPDTYKYG